MVKENHKHYKLNNGVYGILLIVLLAVLSVIIYTAVLTHTLSESVLNNAINESKSRTDAMYKGTIELMNDADFTSINDKSDKSSKIYQKLQSHMNEIRNMNSTRYFYTAKRDKNGKLVYLVDGLNKDASDFRNPGDYIEKEMIPYINKALSGKRVYSNDIVDTTWGHIFTACYPITAKDGSGEIIGALCIETDMEQTYTFISEHRITLIRISCVAIAIILLMMAFALVFLSAFRKSKRKNEQTLQENYLRLERVLARERKHTEIINSLATIYTTIIIGNLETHGYEVVESISLMHETVESNGDFDEVKQKLLDVFIHPDMRDAMDEFLDFDTLGDRLSDCNTVMSEYKDNYGKWMQARFIAKNRDESSNVKEVLYVCREFTDEKKRELELKDRLQATAIEAKKANESKTLFLRRMSHDIRTPLNGIIGMMHIAEKYEGDQDKMCECKEKILHSADYLLDLVNNVLDISKLESGAIILEHEKFNLGQMLLKTLPTVGANAEEHGIKLLGGRDATKLQHMDVIGSPVHLNRVLMNIASNAIKYNRPGGTIKIYCTEISSNEDTATYEFVCADTGLGMSEEFQKHAFEPFTQEGKETTTSFSGSGLGLSIVKDVIEMMGGTVKLESEENVGTTITVTLSLELDKEASGIWEENEPTLDIDLASKNALLVEDNMLNMEIAKVLLEEEGMIITEAHNGKEALELFEDSKVGEFDFIFMDVMMPVMDGLEATREIRKLGRDDATTVPILAMTANAFAEDRNACIDAGMDAHIPKPLKGDAIRKGLAKFI